MFEWAAMIAAVAFRKCKRTCYHTLNATSATRLP